MQLWLRNFSRSWCESYEHCHRKSCSKQAQTNHSYGDGVLNGTGSDNGKQNKSGTLKLVSNKDFQKFTPRDCLNCNPVILVYHPQSTRFFLIIVDFYGCWVFSIFSRFIDEPRRFAAFLEKHFVCSWNNWGGSITIFMFKCMFKHYLVVVRHGENYNY